MSSKSLKTVAKKAASKPKKDPRIAKFNKLLKAIDFHEKEKVAYEKVLDEGLEFHRIKIKPLQEKLNQVHLDLVKTIFKTIPSLKLKKHEQTQASNFIIDILMDLDARPDFDLDEEAKEIFNLVHHVSYETYKEEANAIQLDILKQMFKGDGIDIDTSKYNYEDLSDFNSDAMKALFEEVDQARTKKEEEEGKNKEAEKKSNKQIAEEIKEAQQKSIEAKTLKELYTSLAKIVHPDKELDPNLKLEKEEWMKKLTQAYQEKDLKAMLAIESFWMKETKFNPATASNEKLDLYVKYLNEKLDNLKMEILHTKMNPRYMPLAEFMGFSKDYFMLGMEEEQDNMENHLEDMKNDLKILQDAKRKPTEKKKLLIGILDENGPDVDFMGMLFSGDDW
ncbi:MAG: hypothetical protein Q8R57_04760 [Bacteroidota bacterium]|nr:hypothetical protein [Bacteroidota bacterium]